MAVEAQQSASSVWLAYSGYVQELKQGTLDLAVA